MITVYGIKNCNTMKKTFDYLNQHKIDYQFHNYKTDGIDIDLVNYFLTLLDWNELTNRKGMTWRNLDLAVRENISKESAIKIMLQNASIIKRPLIIRTKDTNSSDYLLGFDESTYHSFFNIQD